MEYELVSKVAVSSKDGRILIEVERSQDNNPFIFSLSQGSAYNLAWAIQRTIEKENPDA